MKILIIFLLIASSYGVHITCQFNYDYNWAVIGRVYTCSIILMDFSDNSTHITGCNGTHIVGKSNAHVQMVNVYSNACPKTIPKGFSNFFPKIIAMRFLNCLNLSFLNGDELNEYSNLEWYGHFGSNLKRVPGEFFASNPKMKVIFFDRNKIQHVGKKLLNDLKYLQQAWFISNVCISQGASNPSQIPALTEVLHQDCTDIELETTTSSKPPRCNIVNLKDFVCGHDEKILYLKGQVDYLMMRNKLFDEKFNKLKEIFTEFIKKYITV